MSNVSMTIKSLYVTIYDVNSTICHHLRDIQNHNVHDIDLNFRIIGPRSNVNMKIKSSYMTLYDDNNDVFHICHHLQDIHNHCVHDLDSPFRIGHGQM